MRKPPTLATWLLSRFVDCSLVGDLLEEYRRGRSRRWYWRQALIAVSRSADGDVRCHPVLALRALLVLVLSVLSYNYCIARPLDLLYGDLMWYLRWHLTPSVFTDQSPLLFYVPIGVLGILVPCIGYVAAGWIVARVHRPHQASFTLMNAAIIVLVGACQLIWFFEYTPPRFGELPQSYWYFRVAVLLLFAVSSLVGGLWQRDDKPVNA